MKINYIWFGYKDFQRSDASLINDFSLLQELYISLLINLMNYWLKGDYI